MPAREAHAKLQAALPNNKIQIMSDVLPTIDKPVIKTFASAPPAQIMMGMEGDQVTVDVTLPPNKQAVWRVIRQHFFADKGIPKTTLLASLREKYGKETFSNVGQGKPASTGGWRVDRVNSCSSRTARTRSMPTPNLQRRIFFPARSTISWWTLHAVDVDRVILGSMRDDAGFASNRSRYR